MRMFTSHEGIHNILWYLSLRKNVKAITAILILSSVFSVNTFGQAGTAIVNPPIGGMKIDGFLQRQSAGIGDWLKGGAGLDGAGTFIFNDNGTNAQVAPGKIFLRNDLFNDQTSDEIFDGGNKLDDNPNVWGWRSGKPPAKDDINHSMIFITSDAQNHIWVLVSGDRLSTNGTSYLDIEFYQNAIVRNNGTVGGAPVLGGKGKFETSGPHGGRTVGDIDVTLSYTGGGTVASISFLTWAPGSEAGSYDYVALTPPANSAWVAANEGTVDVPYGAFGSNSYDALQFIEAAIDVTALLGGGAPNQCSGLPFKSLFIKTKSSAAPTADLKDFIDPIQINPCFDNTAPVITINNNNPLSLGCNPSAGTIEAALGSATASDNCGTQSLTSSDGTVQSSSCSRSKTRTWTAVDACGNVTTASRTATWTADLTVPTISATGNNNPLGCNPTGAAINAALGSASASDGCGPTTVTPSDGPVSSNGCSRSQTRKWTAADGCGNTATASRTANWTEAGALSITCPANVQLQCSDASTSTAVTGVAVANGGCSPSVTSSDQTTTRNCAKLIRRTWTATDACGQTATCVQSILVADNTPPVVQCNGASATATDNCTAPGNILLFLNNGVWTAVDESGNIGTASCAGARMAPVVTQQQEQQQQSAIVEEEKTVANKQINQRLVAPKGLEVNAYPNPYNDQVTFKFVSTESGIAKLELYDVLGKKVSTINIGTVQAGVQRTFDYKIPTLKRISMIYKLSVGSQTGNGKLISGK